MINDNLIQRIPTKIYGLDKLLYGGLDIIKNPFTIVIRGGAGTESTLFGLQLMYGIALSLNEEERNVPFNHPIEPHFLTSCHEIKDIETTMIDTFISSCYYGLTKRFIEKSYKESDMGILTKIFFDTSSILCADNPTEKTPPLPIDKITSIPDKLVAESVMYYNNRTQALHYRTEDSIADLSNMIYRRSCDSINCYLKRKNHGDVNSFLYRQLHTKLIKTNFEYIKLLKNPITKENELPFSEIGAIENDKDVLLTVELDNTKKYSQNQMREFIKEMKKKAKISILIVDDETEIPANDSDILIDLYNKNRNGYVLHYLNLTHNSHQSSVLGEHQYKRRDYGIEVFPSLHTYFKKKKNFHRSLIYTHSSVIEDIFPQYLSRKAVLKQNDASYDDFINNRERYIEENMEAFHPTDNVKLISYDILKKIFLSKKNVSEIDNKNIYQNETGLVTAIIGGGNTYKRYLTIGSAFSAAANGEDTMIIVLNKEKHLIQKRMSCPARMRHNTCKEHCKECYKHFHFMSIYPEYITQDEFIYMLGQCIKLAYDKNINRTVKRIIIDDLQILDYSFPLLEGERDFLSAIMNICREGDISLYILCDKEAKSKEKLRALADNIVCTEKDEKGNPKIYVERCSGYYNPPSKLYCGVVEKIDRLFECNEQYHKDSGNTYSFTLNPVYLEDESVPNINHFWK